MRSSALDVPQECPVQISDTETTLPRRQSQSAQPAPARPGGSEYAELSRLVRDAGLLNRRTRYYTWKILLTIGALAGAWAAFVVVGNSWWTLAVAGLLAVLFTQVGFLGHDAGHRQIFASKRSSYIAGVLLGNLGIGLSYGWWVGKHNRHHAHPNTEGADPDIASGALIFTASQLNAPRGIVRLIRRYQAYLFFPMLLLEGVNLHVASIRALASRASRNRPVEAALLAAHFAGYLALVLVVLGPGLKAVAFIMVQQGLFGLYLGCSFAPNHKGMPVLTASDRSDFLRRQVLTSRNIRGGRLTDLMMGCLNYQIEHHLFPSAPRPSLRRCQPLVMEFCEQHGLPYCETSLADSFATVLSHLNSVGRPSHAGRLAAGTAP
jgi:fatty acid desaturase